MKFARETRGLVHESSPGILAILLWVCVSLAVLAALFGGIIYAVSTPARVAIDNAAFHNSQAYTDGMARDLDNMRLAYVTASPEGKAAIKATVQHRFAGYDPSNLAADQRAFLGSMR